MLIYQKCSIHQQGLFFAANNIRYGNSVGDRTGHRQTPTKDGNASLVGVPGNRSYSETNISTTIIDLHSNVQFINEVDCSQLKQLLQVPLPSLVGVPLGTNISTTDADLPALFKSSTRLIVRS
jgi:hypothetical protein